MNVAPLHGIRCANLQAPVSPLSRVRMYRCPIAIAFREITWAEADNRIGDIWHVRTVEDHCDGVGRYVFEADAVVALGGGWDSGREAKQNQRQAQGEPLEG